jgi:hypothetical protein
MLYFDKFPEIKYNNNVISDITRSFDLKTYTTNKESTFLKSYIIKETDTPESIAYDLYHDATYHWIILTLNNIIDPFNDWVLSTEQLIALCERKYSNGIKGVHHYETFAGEQCDDVQRLEIESAGVIPPGITKITNYEYEYEENNKKKDIIIITPGIVEQLIIKLEDVSNVN